MRRALLAFAALALMVWGPAAAAPVSRSVPMLDRLVAPRQPGPMAPRDECARVPGARTFRVTLAQAVAARDLAALERLATPQVQMGFGGDNGHAELRRAARDPKGSFWRDLAGAIELGCAAGRDGSLTMPWIFAQDPGGDIDAFDALLVRGARVPLRAAAGPRARVLRLLDWQFVELLGPGDEADRFRKVRTSDRTEGFVASGSLRSLVDTRVIAERARGGWKITAIVAGD